MLDLPEGTTPTPAEQRARHKEIRKRLMGKVVREQRPQPPPKPPKSYIIDPTLPRPTWPQWLALIAKQFATDEDIDAQTTDPLRLTVILKSVCQYYGYNKADLLGPRRLESIVSARHVAFYLMRELTNRSLLSIGRFLHKDHTTVIHGADMIRKRLAEGDMKLAMDVAAIKDTLR